MNNSLQLWKHKDKIVYDDFLALSRKMTAKIIFNEEMIHEDVYTFLSVVNTTEVFTNDNYQIDESVKENYYQTLYSHINNPNDESLVKLCTEISQDKEEIMNQATLQRGGNHCPKY